MDKVKEYNLTIMALTDVLEKVRNLQSREQKLRSDLIKSVKYKKTGNVITVSTADVTYKLKRHPRRACTIICDAKGKVLDGESYLTVNEIRLCMAMGQPILGV